MRYTIFFVLFAVCTLSAAGQFNTYFNNRTLRIDYFHTGDAHSDAITLDHFYAYGQWAGNPAKTIDPFNNGRYYVKIYDIATNSLIFSHGFDSYFAEYQTTTPAIEGNKRVFHESVLIPQPRRKILFTIQRRDKFNILQPVFAAPIDPADVHIIQGNPAHGEQVVTTLENGPAAEKVDIVFLAEGYRADEFKKFKKDVRARTDLLFSIEPYKSYKKHFNVRGVFRPSAESGVDEPDRGVYKNSALSSTFYSLDLNRYLLTEDNRTLRDMAGAVPYDAIFIMVNSERYGGGGIYNQYAVFTAHSPANEMVFVHEFGHSFAGLADEYYTSSVAYNDFYPKGVEPTEPNITALLDPQALKWKNEVQPGKALPTDWNKVWYDSIGFKEQALRRQARNLPDGDEKDSLLAKRKKLRAQLADFVANHPLKDKTGFFEGAGYSSTGLYRPQLNCMMFSNNEPYFCKVCTQAIVRMIKFYSE